MEIEAKPTEMQIMQARKIILLAQIYSQMENLAKQEAILQATQVS